MKIERIQVHLPSATPGPNGVVDHHQRISRSGDYPERRREHRQSNDESETGKDAQEQVERLNVDVVTTPELGKENQVPVTTAPVHLLDIKA